MVDALASAEDVKAALGRDLTLSEVTSAKEHLDKTSELFRLEARQQFTAGESRNRLRVTDGAVTLPQKPVAEVISVTGDWAQAQPVPHELFGQRLNVAGLTTGDYVRVHYSHGGPVPDLARLTVAGIVAQLLEADPRAKAGVTQRGETRGPFSVQETYAAWAQGSAPRLAPDDVKVARSFRVRSYGSIIQGY
jgi:hypothetical protein